MRAVVKLFRSRGQFIGRAGPGRTKEQLLSIGERQIAAIGTM
jgi:hypothetical protein